MSGHNIVDLLEKDYEYNSNKATIDSRKERDAYRESKEERKNTPTEELSPSAKAARYAARARIELGEPVDDRDILRQLKDE